MVENVGGASGEIGARRVAQASPDGNTLLLGTVNDMVVVPAMRRQSYSIEQFTPIARVSEDTTVLIGSPGFPHRDLESLIAHCQRSPFPQKIGLLGDATMQTQEQNN